VTILVDTHCHLYFNVFQNDLEEVLKRARDVGVERILVPGVDLTTSGQAILLAESYEYIFAAVGIHPNEANSWDKDSLRELKSLADHPKVVAIGEIGLDYYRDYSDPEVQRSIFRAQLELAAEVNLPVVIHSRQASGDTCAILAEWHQNLVKQDSILAHCSGVLHSFDDELSSAQPLCKQHFYIGINGPVTYQNAALRHQIARQAPLDRILLETDAPLLPPHPHRGERNEPAHIRLIAEKIAELREITSQEVAHQTTQNANLLFAWS
jgi:TatD DNase family protein